MRRWSGCWRERRPGRPGWTDSRRICAEQENSMNDATPVAAADQQVLITRIFDAPREQVFKAWTDPDQVAGWYGPAHFDTPRERIHIDLRVGGRYELTMVQRDSGAEFAIGYQIVDLVEPELIVLRSDPMPVMACPSDVGHSAPGLVPGQEYAVGKHPGLLQAEVHPVVQGRE